MLNVLCGLDLCTFLKVYIVWMCFRCFRRRILRHCEMTAKREE